jgi:hypothetical protein
MPCTKRGVCAANSILKPAGLETPSGGGSDIGNTDDTLIAVPAKVIHTLVAHELTGPARQR